MSKTINILSVIDVETIINNGLKGGDSVENATLLGAWKQSDSYVYMITAQGFIDSNSKTRAGSELTIDANPKDTIQWELTCPGAGLKFNAIIANIGIGEQSHPGSLTPPLATLTNRKIYDKAGRPGYQIVQQTDFVSEVNTTGKTQYNVAFQIMNSTGVSLGFYFWDPFVNALETENFKIAKASFLKKKELTF